MARQEKTQPAGTTAPDVLRVIADVEKHLSRLKQHHAGHGALLEELTKREAEIQAQLDHVRRDSQELERHRSDIEQARRSLDNDRAQTEQARQDVEAQRAALTQQASEIEQQRQRLEAEASDVRAQREGIEAARAEADAEIQRRRQELDEKTTQLQQQAEALKQELDERDKSTQAELDQARAQAAAAEASARQAGEESAAAHDALADANRRADEAVGALTAAQQRADQAAEALQAARQQAEAAASAEAQATGRVEQLEAALTEQAKRLDEAQGSTASLTQRAEAAEAAQAEIQAQTQQQLEQAKSVLEDLTRQRDEAQGALQDAARRAEEAESQRAELAGAVETLTDTKDKLEAGLSEAHAQLQEREQQLGAALEKLQEVSEALEAAAESGVDAGAAMQELNDRDAKLEALGERVRELETGIAERDAMLVDAQQRLQAAPEAVSDDAETRHMQEQLEQSKRRLEAARAEIEQLRSRSAGAPLDDDGMALRRRRLSRLKAALRERAAKLQHAGEVLGQRAAEYEQIMETKARVEAGERALARRADALAKASGAKSVGVAMLCFLVVIGAIAGASWLIAGKVAPATFAARAAIEVDPRGMQLSPAQVAEWQTYHEALIAEAQLMEIAADRMKRRGLATLATPALLRQYLDGSLTTSSATDGTLAFELRGDGSSRTERVLDTFVTAVVSHANAGRERRADGAATRVATEAKADADALDDQRIMYAGGMFGGGSLVCLLVGGLMWRRLVETQRQLARAEASSEVVDGFETLSIEQA